MSSLLVDRPARERTVSLWRSERLRQNLERHLAVQLRVGGLPDLPHPSLADEGGHVVVAEAIADVQGHQLGYRIERRLSRL